MASPPSWPATNQRAQAAAPPAATADAVAPAPPQGGRFAAYLPTVQRHGWALGTIILATIIGQVGELYRELGAVGTLDTVNYLSATNGLVGAGQFFDPLRTPGYPLFLAIFVEPGLSLFWVMFVQTVLTVVLGFAIYILGLRLSGRRLPAAIAAALCASNLYFTQWERDVLSETLSYASLVALFFACEWYLHTRRRAALVTFAAVSFVGIMIRPFNVYVPLLLLLLIAIQDARLGRLRIAWRRLALATGAIYLPLVAYMGGNLVVNQFFGLSNVTNLNLFGKVLEYRLYDETNDPRYAQIKADVDAYAATVPPNGYLDPFRFIYVLHPEYQRGGIADLGSYSRSILLSHPAPVLAGSVADTLYALNPAINRFHTSEYYTLTGTISGKQHPEVEYTSTWKKTLLAVNRTEYLIYPLLPLVVVALGIWWWRRPRSTALPVLFGLALSIVGDILIIGVLSYDRPEASRLRFPFDWGMFLLVAILAVEGVTWLRGRFSQGTTGG